MQGLVVESDRLTHSASNCALWNRKLDPAWMLFMASTARKMPQKAPYEQTVPGIGIRGVLIPTLLTMISHLQIQNI